MREVQAIDVKQFLFSCATRVTKGTETLLTHAIDGRLIKSIPSENNQRDFFIIKLKDQRLFQRYMIAMRETNSFGKSENIFAYAETLDEAESLVN